MTFVKAQPLSMEEKVISQLKEETRAIGLPTEPVQSLTQHIYASAIKIAVVQQRHGVRFVLCTPAPAGTSWWQCESMSHGSDGGQVAEDKKKKC